MRVETGKIAFYTPRGGQIQVRLGGPNWENKGDVSSVERNGALFLEGAPPDPKKEGFLDWSNQKVIFAMSDKDIAAILFGLTTIGVKQISAVHANEDKTIVKTFGIKQGDKPDREGNPTYLLSLSSAEKDEARINVNVFVSAADLYRLKLVLANAIPYMLGWHTV